MRTITDIRVPTDFSEFSLAGLDYIISLSVLYDAQIYNMQNIVPIVRRGDPAKEIVK